MTILSSLRISKLRFQGLHTTRALSTDSFNAYVVGFDRKGGLESGIQSFAGVKALPCPDPEATCTVRVKYSTLNYKDGMIVQGHKGVVTPPGKYPIVPGIDAAGEVIQCSAGRFQPGDRVVVTGNKIGQHFDGGYSQILHVKSEWLTPLPPSFSLEESMMIGSAGVTAMQCVMHLEEAAGLKPNKGQVLVTGAAGGLGSLAVAILAQRGYEVVASSGRASSLKDYFLSLGAAECIGRLERNEKRPLDRQLWAGAIDTVGGNTLAAALAQTRYRCGVASTGVAGSSALETTVYPFILRGVRLLGVDSTLPHKVAGWPDDDESRKAYLDERRHIWERLASDLPLRSLHSVHGGTIGLTEVWSYSSKILAGDVRGRITVDVDK